MQIARWAWQLLILSEEAGCGDERPIVPVSILLIASRKVLKAHTILVLPDVGVVL
jgi:hypothetical protein